MAKYLRKRKNNPIKILLIILIVLIIVIFFACLFKFINESKNFDDDQPEIIVSLIEDDYTIENTETVEKETIPSFSSDTTLSYEYNDKVWGYMPYGLITPSSANEGNDIPLIVSLHGRQEIGCSDSEFENSPIVKLMNNWELEGFNAYVLFPHLTGSYEDLSWNNHITANNVINLVQYIAREYNIDESRIIIQGSDIGSYGSFYIAGYKKNMFSAIVPISPRESTSELIKIIDIPVRCYVGSKSNGGDINCIKFAFGRIAGVFGHDSVIQIENSNENISVSAFIEDADSNNKSDLIEWMLTQTN